MRPCYPRPWFQDAPQILVVAGNRTQAWVREIDGYCALETDLAIAMDHLILAADHEGVATCWIAHFDPLRLREALALRADQEVYALTPLGYPHPDSSGRASSSGRPWRRSSGTCKPAARSGRSSVPVLVTQLPLRDTGARSMP